MRCPPRLYELLQLSGGALSLVDPFVSSQLRRNSVRLGSMRVALLYVYTLPRAGRWPNRIHVEYCRGVIQACSA